MYSRYLCIHVHYYKYENDKGQRILSGKSTVFVLPIGIYRNVVQIEKRHTSPALAFKCKHGQTFYLIWHLHVESKHGTYASLCYFYNIHIFQYVTQNSTFTR